MFVAGKLFESPDEAKKWVEANTAPDERRHWIIIQLDSFDPTEAPPPPPIQDINKPD